MNQINTNGGKWLVAQREVARSWLQGYDASEISNRTGISVTQVKSLVKAIQGELREFHRANLNEMTDQAVAGFDLVKSTAWEWMDSDSLDKGRGLGIVLRAEEMAAKAKGVLNDNVKITQEHTIKLYDFRDNFPAPIEGTATEIPELPSPENVVDAALVPDEQHPVVEDEVVEAVLDERNEQQRQRAGKHRNGLTQVNGNRAYGSGDPDEEGYVYHAGEGIEVEFE